MVALTRIVRSGMAATLAAGIWLAAAGAGVRPAEAPEASAAPAGAEPQEQQIARLIAQLGDKEYYVRQRAENELAKLGFEAFDALTAAASHDDLEVAARARYLLRLMKVEWTARDDPKEVKSLLANYEQLKTEEKLTRMSNLAELPGGVGLPALCRLVRYEKSPLLSKQAAVRLLRQQAGEGPPGKSLAEAVQKTLARNARPAARWLTAWLSFRDDPQAALEQWGKLVDAEQILLRDAPNETSAEIVAGLLRVQIDWLKRLDQPDKTVAAMRRLIDLEEGDPASLVELLDWLVQQKAFSAVDDLERRFQAQIEQNPVLLYALAEIRAERGEKDRAEKLAGQALKLYPGKELENLVRHLPTAYRLRRRGLFTWAEREYRHMIDNAPPAHDLAAVGCFGLSEMFHDQERDEEAAKLLETVLKLVQEHRPDAEVISRRSPAEVRSRMHYFLACHFKQKHDETKEQEHLAAALKSDDVDIDALIACYHRPKQSAEERQKVVAIIQKMAADTQQKINDEPNDANNYNQYAWLVGNTEGDLDLAIRYSKKSIEMSTEDRGGFYDTLAHVYFTKGDYAEAVKVQTKAAELEPHSGQIARELKVFREKLESAEKK